MHIKEVLYRPLGVEMASVVALSAKAQQLLKSTDVDKFIRRFLINASIYLECMR